MEGRAFFMRNLNIENFIEAVRVCPAIWDMRVSEYSDKIKKSEAWREVGRKCLDDFDNLEPTQQNAFVKDLHKKWKNLRQCYKRERDSQVSKSGSAKKKKLKYVYYDILSFLAPVFAAKPTHSNIGDAEQGDDEEDEEEEEEEGGHVEEATEEVETENTNIPLQSSTAPRKRKRASENPVADICLVLKRSLEAAEQRKVEEKKTMDEDTNFLMSLLNYIRPVQGLNKLAMRSEILQVVTKYYNMTQHPQNLYPSSSQRYPLPRHFSPYPSSSYIPSYPSHVMTAPSPVMNVPSFSAYTSSDSTSPQLSELCSPQRDPCQQTADLDFPHDTV